MVELNILLQSGFNGKVESISAGDSHTCAVISGGQGILFGENETRVSWVLQQWAIEILLRFLLVVVSFLEEDC